MKLLMHYASKYYSEHKFSLLCRSMSDLRSRLFRVLPFWCRCPGMSWRSVFLLPMSFLSSGMLPASSLHGLCERDGFSSPGSLIYRPRSCVGCRLCSGCFRMASYVCALEHLAFLGTVKCPFGYPWLKESARCLIVLAANVAAFRPNNSARSHFLVLLLYFLQWTQSDRHCNRARFFDCHSLSRILTLFSLCLIPSLWRSFAGRLPRYDSLSLVLKLRVFLIAVSPTAK
jgi:hypothetical protein